MMFTLDRSMHFIEATEQNVLAIYRSVAVVAVSLSGAVPQNFEAFVSVIMEDDVAHVYVALVEAFSKKVHVFTTDNNSPGSGSYTDTLKEAVSFAESLGFDMESVNLNYGRALKEVIVRSMRIFTTPKSKKKDTQSSTQTGKHGIEINSAKRASDRTEVGKSSDEDINSESFMQDKSGVGKQIPGQAGLERLALEKTEREQVERELQLTNKIEAEKITAEIRAEEQAEAARVAIETAEVERREREKLAKEKAEAEMRANQQAESVRRVQEIIETERIDRERIHYEKIAAEKREKDQAEIARVALERAEAERAEKETLLLEKAAVEKSAAEQIELERCTREKIQAELIEREHDLVEKAAAEKLAVERAEQVRLRAESYAAEKFLADKADAARHLREKAKVERIDSERLFADKAAAVRLAEEKVERVRQAQAYAEAEKAERESMLAEKAVAENHAAEQIEAARLAWEKAEAERVECENQLAEKSESLKLAAQQAAAAQLAVNSARVERNERKKILLERLESEKSAAEQAEAAQLAWEAARAEQPEIDQLTLEKGTTERLERNSFREKTEADELSSDLGRATEFPREEAREEQDKPEYNSVENVADEKIKSSQTDAARSVSDLGESGRGKQENMLAVRATVDKRAQELVDLARLDRDIDATGSTEQSDAHAIDFLSGIRSKDELPFFGYREATTAVRFSIVASQLNIEYDDAAEEIESLHQSLNMVRVTIEGFPSQNCTAFLCAVKRAGTQKVYVALYLEESNRALIYLPEKQPESAEECDRIINDGITFAETAGFMMVKVGFDSKEKLAELLENIPVFGRES
jgi:hypothetical protein